MGKFWTLGSLVGKKRELVDLKGIRDLQQSNLDHKIRNWKVAPEEIAKLDVKIAKLEREIKN